MLKDVIGEVVVGELEAADLVSADQANHLVQCVNLAGIRIFKLYLLAER